MAMTLRLDDSDDAAVAATAAREHTSKHDVIVRAVRAYTGDRQHRLEAAILRVTTRDADILARLGDA